MYTDWGVFDIIKCLVFFIWPWQRLGQKSFKNFCHFLKGGYPIIFAFQSVYKISNSCWFCIHFWIKWELWKTFDTKMIGWTHFRQWSFKKNCFWDLLTFSSHQNLPSYVSSDGLLFWSSIFEPQNPYLLNATPLILSSCL